ncbi:DoxX family membrane protein [Nocardia sp. NBC_00508]|uniref:DoxX family protein n=1 Tax=Nocardia sp. NBC_00508 TaxID=2975992 RepID=UPI002E802C5C|nr:DoxX family membrane protein [Nocardia sp. NBC_00508]WUD68334.1 DoxX family membrane protein [Nocardia sp. NBC_00508]
MTIKSVLERTSGNTQLDGISTDIGLLIMRVVFGGLLAAHGAQKLFGWWGGPGWRANADGFEQMGYNPGKIFGTLAGLSELGGGLLLLLGLLTPLGAAIVLGTMINAINATWSGGLLTGKGYEMGVLFAAAAAALAFTGAGKFSLDAGRPWERKGFAWGVGAVILAVVSGVLTLILKWVL